MRNIEIKARCPHLDRAEAACRRVGAQWQWTRRQTDTYFDVPEGRLKLRVEDAIGATLITYRRANDAGPRACLYTLTEVEDPQEALASLASQHGTKVCVAKTRTLYLLGNVRIHLDQVDGLGTFVEFEAVMRPQDDDGETRRHLEGLLAEFAVGQTDLIGHSYADLLLDAAASLDSPDRRR